MLTAIAGMLLNQVNNKKANNAAEQQAEADAALNAQNQQRQHILDNRANAQQISSSIGLQGMDMNRQAAYQKQQDYFNSVMQKYRVGGVQQ